MRSAPASSATLDNAFALSWSWTLRVADGECTLAEARRSHLDELTRLSGPWRLLGPGGVALLHGLSRRRAAELTREADFPAHVAVLSGMRVWHRRDLEIHRRGQRSRRRRGELETALADTAQAAAMLGISPNRLLAARHRGDSRLPAPAGIAANKPFWVRHDLEVWMAAHDIHHR